MYPLNHIKRDASVILSNDTETDASNVKRTEWKQMKDIIQISVFFHEWLIYGFILGICYDRL